MPSAVYLHDGEKQITVRFPTEEDRERFKAHYRALDALAMQYRDALAAAEQRVAVLCTALTEVQAVCRGAMQSYFQGDVGDCFDAWRNVQEGVDAALATADTAPRDPETTEET